MKSRRLDRNPALPGKLTLACATLVVSGMLQTGPVRAQAIESMAANASPSFEVATIKPSHMEAPGDKRFLISGGHRLTTANTTLEDLIVWAYLLHPKQIIDEPAWARTDKYDFDGEQDGQGRPNIQQWKTMVQKMLAERFQLTFHREQRELPVYALAIAKDGSKLIKSQGDPKDLPGIGFRPPSELGMSNAPIASLVELLDRSVLDRPVLDRPVVDQTGLLGRYDVTLKWTSDSSPAGGDNTDLFTAIQEQLGLKLVATRAPAEVFVIDHVERPSEN